MHAIFVAHGPLAEHIKAVQRKRAHVPHRRTPALAQETSTEKGKDEITVIPGFDNLELYNLITQKLLKLSNVAPNNGTANFWDKYLDA